MRLTEIADTQIGYQHREQIERASEGTHWIIQPKDVSGAGELAVSDLCRITPRSDPKRYQVTAGDVIYLSRGQRCYAVPISEDLTDTIAAYYFYILRLHDSKVLPEYLAWYINQPPAQKFIESRMRGSLMKMITKSAFEQLEVEIPPIKIQQYIVQLERLRRREEAWLSKLTSARKRLVQGLSLEAVRNDTLKQEKDE